MIYSDTSTIQKIAVLKTAIDKADAIIIGAGAGLSIAAGLAYDNADTFNTLFPGYQTATASRPLVRRTFTTSTRRKPGNPAPSRKSSIRRFAGTEYRSSTKDR
jgi:NAD-dependent SIR2 family protein deacetylase